jgi:hypothetical protein
MLLMKLLQAKQQQQQQQHMQSKQDHSRGHIARQKMGYTGHPLS